MGAIVQVDLFISKRHQGAGGSSRRHYNGVRHIGNDNDLFHLLCKCWKSCEEEELIDHEVVCIP